MGLLTDGKKTCVIITKPKSIQIDLPVKINKSLQHDIKFIVIRNGYLIEYTNKEIRQFLFKYGHEHKKRKYLLESLKLYIKQVCLTVWRLQEILKEKTQNL